MVERHATGEATPAANDTAVVCCPRSVTYRRVMACPTCGTRRRFVGEVAAWYAPLWTCCACGDTWDAEEGRLPRPFARGWREKEAARARARWSAAPTRDEARRIFAEMVREATA